VVDWWHGGEASNPCDGSEHRGGRRAGHLGGTGRGSLGAAPPIAGVPMINRNEYCRAFLELRYSTWPCFTSPWAMSEIRESARWMDTSGRFRPDDVRAADDCVNWFMETPTRALSADTLQRCHRMLFSRQGIELLPQKIQFLMSLALATHNEPTLKVRRDHLIHAGIHARKFGPLASAGLAVLVMYANAMRHQGQSEKWPSVQTASDRIVALANLGSATVSLAGDVKELGTDGKLEERALYLLGSLLHPERGLPEVSQVLQTLIPPDLYPNVRLY
jgi:hypothetical protein